MNAQLTTRMLAVGAITMVAAFPLMWLLQSTIGWDVTFHSTLGWWLFAVVVYCVARIAQIAVYLHRTKGTSPEARNRSLSIDDFYEQYPEFTGDLDTDRMGVLYDDDPRSTSLTQRIGQRVRHVLWSIWLW